MTYAPAGVNAFQPEKTYDLIFRQDVRYYIDTGWMQYLSPTETKIINFLCSRTMYWGKVWEIITLRHWMSGSDGNFGGTGLSKPTVLTCLAKLMKDGFIRRRKVGDTHAYSIDVKKIGTEEDPVLERIKTNRVRVKLMAEFQLAKQRAQREAVRQYEETGDEEYLQMACEIGHQRGSKIFTLRDDIYSHTTCSNVDHTSYALPALHADAPEALKRIVEQMPLPTKREDKKGAKPRAEKQRSVPLMSSERRGNAATGAVVQSAIDHREAGPQRRRRVPASEQDTPAPYVARKVKNATQIANEAATRRRKKARAAKPTLTAMVVAWNDTHSSVYRCDKMNWTERERARMKALLRVTEMPNTETTWVDVLQWFVTDYGRACELAIPFMLRDADKRQDILDNTPRLPLFLRFGEEFLNAYHSITHGIRPTEARMELADDRQQTHERFMERRNMLRDTHVDELPVDLATEDELIDQARREGFAEDEVRTMDAFDELDARLEQAGASGRERQQAQEEANARVTYERQQDDQAAQLDAVLERNRQWVRDEYGDDLTDEECDEILEEEFGDDE